MSTKKTSRTASAKTTKKSVPHASVRVIAKAHAGAKDSAPQKVPVRKASAPRAAATTAKPKHPKTAAPKKNLSKKTVKTTPIAIKPAPKVVAKTVPRLEHKPSPSPSEHKRTVHFSKADLDQFKFELLAMRDRITGQSGSMRTAALQRTDEVNPEEDGTDAFMRLQTLEQVSSQHQIIANIDEALRAIEKGTYGVCDTCGELISKPRLSVLPFAKNCIKCQSEMENPRRMDGRR